MYIYKGFNSIEELVNQVKEKGLQGRKLENYYIVLFYNMYYLVGIESAFKQMVIGKELAWYKHYGNLIQVDFDKYELNYKIREDNCSKVIIPNMYNELLMLDENTKIYGLYECWLNGNITELDIEKLLNILSLLACTFQNTYYSSNALKKVYKYFSQRYYMLLKRQFKDAMKGGEIIIGINPFVGSVKMIDKTNKEVKKRLAYIYKDNRLIDIIIK